MNKLFILGFTVLGLCLANCRKKEVPTRTYTIETLSDSLGSVQFRGKAHDWGSAFYFGLYNNPNIWDNIQNIKELEILEVGFVITGVRGQVMDTLISNIPHKAQWENKYHSDINDADTSFVLPQMFFKELLDNQQPVIPFLSEEYKNLIEQSLFQDYVIFFSFVGNGYSVGPNVSYFPDHGYDYGYAYMKMYITLKVYTN